jgi:hypothetical protein
MTIIELLAKVSDRARTLAGRGVSIGEGHVRVQLPDGQVLRIREVQPTGDGILIHVE